MNCFCLDVDLGAALAAQHRMFQLDSANLIGNLVFSSIGFVAFIYGKRMQLWKMMLCGLALMIFPYFVGSTSLLFEIGGAGTAVLFFFRN